MECDAQSLALVTIIREPITVMGAHEFAALRTLAQESQFGAATGIRQTFRERFQLTYFSDHTTIIAKRG